MKQKTNLGIYKITNTENGKVYIGSSVNLKSRKYKHYYMLKNNKHDNCHLQRAYNQLEKQYSENTKNYFKWEVVEYIQANIDKQALKKEILEKEQYHIEQYSTSVILYNICPVAGNCLGKGHTDEAKRKIGQASKGNKYRQGHVHSEETRKKISKGNKGKKVSIETCEKISKRKKGHKVSKETRQKISNANKGNKPSNRVRVINLDTGRVFNSLREAELFYEIGRGHIVDVCKGRLKKTGGYRWAYLGI